MYFILYSHSKSIGYVWRGIKAIFRPQKLYRAETTLPVLKFLDPPLIIAYYNNIKQGVPRIYFNNEKKKC